MRTVQWEVLLRWFLLLAVLAGLPILLHGCHGDEDHELFAPIAIFRR